MFDEVGIASLLNRISGCLSLSQRP